MSFLQTIWADLVEKRLWPVAVAMVIALVAIPLLVTGKSSTPTAQTFAGTVTGPTAPQAGNLGPTALSAPQVKLLQATTRHAASGPRDPFGQPKIPKVTVKAVQVGPGPSSGSSGGSSSTQSAGTSTPSTTVGPTTTTTPSPKPGSGKSATDTSLYRVSLRVGQSGSLKAHSSVQRLSPLPSVTDPFFVFMGVLSDGKTAVFLLSSDAKATGDGVCKPTPDNCQTVEMKADDIEFFDVAGSDPTAAPTQYELDLSRIIKTHAATGAVAARARARVAQSGRTVVNEARAAGVSQLADYAYSARLGVLQRRLPTLSDVLANIARSSAAPAAPPAAP